jgi:HlyD family secretion protein
MSQPKVFRQAALDRLSSPEQLDMLMHVTSVRRWMSLLAVLLLIAIAVGWGWFGSVSTTADGQGVIVRVGGVHNIVASGSGVLISLNASVGDHINSGQVVAVIGQPELAVKLNVARQELEALRRERKRVFEVRSREAGLQVEALERQRANQTHEISVLESQAKLAEEQVGVAEQLYAKGLMTRQQTIAAREKVVSIEGQIAQIRAQAKQLDAQQFSYESQPKAADAEVQNRVADAERKVRVLESELGIASQVVSSYSGEVIELQVYPGGTVAEGAPILSVQPDVNELDLVLYVPSIQAKNITEGMRAEVSPSTVKREEFGFLRGTVTHVADYPATPASLTRIFQNQSLINSLAHEGPVTEVYVSLERDASTPSGFRWSSRQGPSVLISSGTLCNARIVTREQRPITLLFPSLKKKTGMV